MFPTFLRWPLLIGLFAAVVVLVTSLLQCISGRGELVEIALPLLFAILLLWGHGRLNQA